MDDATRTLGVGQVWAKDESTRFGLPAYKALGALYAGVFLLGERLDVPEHDRSFGEVGRRAKEAGLRLVAPTDGNHGRAVARLAHLLGLPATILFPAGTAQARIDAVMGEGAETVVTESAYVGTWDEAAAMCDRDPAAILVTDYSPDEHAVSPRLVIEGYATIFDELQEQLEAVDAGVDVIAVQVGAGALAAAVAAFAQRVGAKLLTVEPSAAACLLASLRRQRPAATPGPHPSAMAGLNCDLPSAAALPSLLATVDAAVAIDDVAAAWAVRALADEDLAVGESGAAGLAGLAVALGEPAGLPVHERLGLDASSNVLVMLTERVTDPVSYQACLDERSGWSPTNTTSRRSAGA